MTTLYVLASGAAGTGSSLEFASLEDAVNAAEPGDTIQLAAGYVQLESTDTDGHIDIRKDLTIIGAGKGETILRAERPTEKCMIGVVGTACVTFMDFTLDGADEGPNGGVAVFAGITFIENSTGVIQNMEIKNIGEDSLDLETGLGGAGRGIFLLDNAHVTVSGTDFSDNERDDILARGTSTVIINNESTFTANVEDASREYGVRARDSATVDVSNSTFSGYVTEQNSTEQVELSAAIRGQDTTKLFIREDTTFIDNSNAILAGVTLDDAVTLTITGTITVDSTQEDAVAVRGQGNGLFSGADYISGPTKSVVFTGGAAANNIRGGGGNDWLDGGVGADTMSGRAGDDTYVVDNTNDKINEGSGNGVDTVLSSVTFSLASQTGQEIENLTLTGTGNINATGNGLANTLTGNTGNNTLNGGGGIDTLNGGAGGDVLIGGVGGDTIDNGVADDNVTDVVRFSATNEFGDLVFNFDVTGAATQVDRVEFGGALNSAWDDGKADDNFNFGTSNSGAGTVNVTVGQADGNREALLLTGVGTEGVTDALLRDAGAVCTAFNSEFNITAANGEDALLVVNATDSDNFALWQWIQASGGETAAGEVTLVGVFNGNGNVTSNGFDFI